MPFGIGLVLFSPDLVHFVLGKQWESAVIVLQAFGVISAVSQLGFNWTAFLRALNYTKPMAILAAITVVTFGAIVVPLMFLDGLRGYALGMVTMTFVTVGVRTYFLAKLFSGFQMLWHAARAIAPSVPAVLVVLAMHAVDPAQRTLPIAIGEFTVYAIVTVGATLVFERALLREIVGYLRPAETVPVSAGG
jgi:O-antigen/teichoic acid export membrane protein